MKVEPAPTERSLEEAIEFAIARGAAAAASLEHSVDETLLALRASIEPLRPWMEAKSAKGHKQTPTAAAERYVALVQSRERQIAAAFARQKKSLKTFNIALFGRTGAGKSSLIEALSGGQGKSVSQGESDWTTEVRAVPWKACVLVDTPGINGWGRSRSRAELEERARMATESADVVLLCFDTQSQQESEFAKVAEWIQKYRKPAVAILNARNPRWRMPTLVHLTSARETVSQAIHQNASNIRDELAKIGLTSIPIVALSSKRALFARAREPFEGPDASTLTRQRQEHGRDQLLAWSNLEAFEALLVESLTSDAAALRTGMLRDTLNGTLKSLATELEALEREAQQALDLVENAVEAIFKIVGYPKANERERFEDKRVDGDLLTHLEALRRGAFQSARVGEFGTYLRHLLSSMFAPLRSEALNKADQVITEAFDANREISGKDFNRRVLPMTALEAAAQAVIKDSARFLQRKIDLASRDADVDFRCLAADGASIAGAAGKSYKWASTASRGAGLLAGAVSTLGALAVTQIWNPVGWTAGVAAAVATVAGLLMGILGWGGRKAQKKAEEKRLAARREAIANAGKHVNQVFDDFVSQVQGHAARYAQDSLATRLVGPMREAISLRLVLKSLRKTGGELQGACASLAHHHNPMKVFERAAARVEALRFPRDPAAARKLWLGESWVEDPLGHVADHGDSTVKRTQAYAPGFFESTVEQIRGALAKFIDKPKPGAGKAWLEEFRETMKGDAEASPLLRELQSLTRAGKPRLHLHGDYNAGKSSFIKRVLIDAGLPVPQDLAVRADPTTAKVSSYDWLGIELVDSPGFQSGRDEDTLAAVRASPDASFILYLFQPNLVTGSVEALQSVLKGDESTGFISKLNRTFFIINRADELGVDPAEDLEGFTHLCDRKRTELIQALGSQGLDVSPDRVFCMASDPYGLAGDRRDLNSTHFDPFRPWDGHRALAEAFRKVRPELIRVGCDISVLEGGAARVAQLSITLKERLKRLQQERGLVARIQTAVDDALDEGRRVSEHVEGALQKAIDEHAYRLLGETFSAVDEAELEALAKQLAQWWKDKAFVADVERWHSDSRKTIDEWAERVQDEVGRRFGSAEFAATFPELTQKFEAETLSPKKKGTAATILEALSKPLQMSGSRDVVYEIGKFIGVNFRPWGAIKWAGYFGKANVVLAAGGIALDVADWWSANKNEAKRESARANARTFVNKTAAQYRLQLLRGDGGPSAYFDANRSAMVKHRDALAAEVSRLDADARALQARIDGCVRLWDSARNHLGMESRHGK